MPLKIEDVLALARAGYTRADIDTMLAPTQGPAPAPEPAPAHAPAPAPEPAPAHAPAPAPAPESDPFKRLAEEIVKGIQSGNRQMNNGGQGNGTDYIDMLNKIL